MKNFSLILLFTLFIACKKDISPKVNLKENELAVLDHQIAYYTDDMDKEFLIVFESGLGDDHTVWQTKKVAEKSTAFADVLLYDRAGYGHSTSSGITRDIPNLSNDLHTLIEQARNGRKLILVGHSLGGMIIRDYAIKYPAHVAGLLFVDASHELYNSISQDQENQIVQAFVDAYGQNSAAVAEASELIEDSAYMASLPMLPDVPTVAVSSMKVDKNHTAADRKLWFDSKEALGVGLSHFQHITTEKSGHYIMIDEPELVLKLIKELVDNGVK